MANELEQKRVVSFPESLRGILGFDNAIPLNLDDLLTTIGSIAEYICDKLKSDTWYQRRGFRSDVRAIIEEGNGKTQVFVEDQNGEMKNTRFTVLPEEGDVHRQSLKDIVESRGYLLNESLSSDGRSVYVQDTSGADNHCFVRIRTEEITEGKDRGKYEVYLTAKHDVRTVRGESNIEFEVSIDNLEACQRFWKALGYFKASSKQKLPSKLFKPNKNLHYSIEVNYIGSGSVQDQVVFVEIERKIEGEISDREELDTLRTIDSIFDELRIPRQNIIVTKYCEIADVMNGQQW